jgi:hypothetical protein
MFEDFKDDVIKRESNRLGSISIHDRELREAAKQAEEAFRENNGLPILEKNPAVTDQQVIDKAKIIISEKIGLAPTNENIVAIAEKIITEKALKDSAQNLKRFQYFDNNRLTAQIQQIYPESTHLTIINNDKRDGLGVPTITTRTLRNRFTNISWSQGKRVLHSVNYAVFQICICIIENAV